MDMLVASTGAILAWVWYLCREKFDDICHVINRRILKDLHDRVIHPFLEHTDELYWMGYPPNYWVNNWCPWIISNVLNVCAMTVTDRDEWERVVQISLTGLDRFVRMYEEDGACDEGPAYWCSAGGSLYNACLVLRDMTGGRWNPFDHPLMRSLSVNPTSMQKGIGNEI